jgi:hypothetical protein
VEVTLMAGLLFALPICYYYGRPYALGAQDKVYNFFFKIDEEQYKRMKELQRQARLQELEQIEEVKDK